MPTRPIYPRSLTPLPSHPWYHHFHWADYVELLCLVNPDVMVTEADVLDRLPFPDAVDQGVAELHDKWDERVDTWFQHLDYRQGSFGDAYPFEFSSSSSGNVLRLRDPLTPDQELYLTLLYSANLWSVLPWKKMFTDSFEVISLWALKQHLPNTASVRLFGSNSLTDAEMAEAGVKVDHYVETTLWSRMKALAETLREEVIAKESEYPPSNTGDGGLDIVAVFLPGDKEPGMFIVFGQCACTVEWETKQFSSHWVNWRDKIRFLALPLNAVFIPHCFRNTDGQWHARKSISGTVMFDRLRIVQLLKGKAVDLQNLPALVTVRDLVQQREPLV